jgi:hypothetical protein
MPTWSAVHAVYGNENVQRCPGRHSTCRALLRHGERPEPPTWRREKKSERSCRGAISESDGRPRRVLSVTRTGSGDMCSIRPPDMTRIRWDMRLIINHLISGVSRTKFRRNAGVNWYAWSEARRCGPAKDEVRSRRWHRRRVHMWSGRKLTSLSTNAKD